MRLVSWVAAAALGAAAAVVVAVVIGQEPAPEDEPAPTIVLGEGAGGLPAQSADDWATYADHVVVAHVLRETEVPPTSEEVDRGEGVILRDLVLRVDRVLWSSPDPARTAPTLVRWRAWGWAFRGAERLPMAAVGAPRLERGHQYVVALRWQCAERRWGGLSGDAQVPVDGGLLGRGELEGRLVDEPRPVASELASLRERLAGRPVEDLRDALLAAVPRPAEPRVSC